VLRQVLGTIFVAVVGTAGPLLAQKAAAPPNDTCLACHGDADAKSGTGKSIAVDEKKFAQSVHGGLGLECVACHVDLAKTTEFPHAEKLARVNCASCHDQASTAYDAGIHAQARRQTPGSVAATCVDCHTTHEIRSSKDPEARTYPLNLPDMCGRCHGNAAIIAQGRIQAGNVADLYRDSIHGKAITRSGLLVAANCTSCHGSHDIRPKIDAHSRVHRSNVPSTCGACHGGIKTQFDSGVHGMALVKGDARAPVCADCHTAHAIQRTDVASWQLDVIRECGTCHADKIKTYRDTFHGQVTSLGFVRVATCSSCHGAHAVYAKSDPRSTVSDARLLDTCRQCHASATPGFVRYDPHADKADKARNPALFYASRFMTWLLAGTFGFFGLHALLWLPRGFAARRQRPPDGGGSGAAEPGNANG
jgi:nitrate/TMAO reductase-like tetraheme cytochrome c subunit